MSKGKTGIERLTATMGDKLTARRNESKREDRPTSNLAGNAMFLGKLKDGLEEQLNEARAEIAQLTARLENNPITKVDPKKIRPSRFYNRFLMDTAEEADAGFKELKRSIQTTEGNLVPILITPTPPNDEGHTYEIVYGHRRWAACDQLEIPVTVQIEESLEPRVIATLQLIENSERKNPSVIDRALQIASQMQNGAWASQREFCLCTGITESTVSRLQSIASMPCSQIQLAHPDHHRISFRQAIEIATEYKRSPNTIIQRLNLIRKKKKEITAEQATQILLQGKVNTNSNDRKRKLLAWTASSNGLTLKLRNLSTATTNEVVSEIEKLLRKYELLDAAPPSSNPLEEDSNEG